MRISIPVNLDDLVQQLDALELDYLIVAATRRQNVLKKSVMTPEEKEMCDHNPIGAIKSVRTRLGITLRDAKDIVDAYRYGSST